VRLFWVWFAFLFISWSCAFIPEAMDAQADELPWRLGSGAAFFAAFFVAPLLKNKPAALFSALASASVLASISLWPSEPRDSHAYALLVYSILAAKAVYRLPPAGAAAVGAVLTAGASLSSLYGQAGFPLPYILLYATMLGTGLVLFRKIWLRREETSALNETLLSEYRMMKRRLISDERHAREEERAQVGRDIHDSVGHKLTALLMQLEVHRMQADGEAAEMLQGLKDLAKESLEETRNAVRSLDRREAGGLAAILGLLRRLESESFMRIHLTVRHGALAAPLSNGQSIAVYRAVQEAMTNAMKHGSARAAHIVFEAPGGGVFRFEVANEYAGIRDSFREGYGLRAMRERVEKAGGRLDISDDDNRFVVRGTFDMSKKPEAKAT